MNIVFFYHEEALVPVKKHYVLFDNQRVKKLMMAAW